MEKKKNIFEQLGFEDSSKVKHGLHGHISIFKKNNKTGEVSLWEESDNIIPISGYQTLLLKLFGLHLDSIHDPSASAEKLDQDTNLIIPDLNNNDSMHIGVNPVEYQVMTDEYGSEHFVQGFMVGDGGAAEDINTTKNTDYSFINLRSPIPFQEVQSGGLDPTIANKYLGKLRIAGNGGNETAGSAFYIKKFDDTPHVYHSWYCDGQKWDYVDPVNQSDLGPVAANLPKTNRIETYVQCNLTIDSDDCMAYFNSANGGGRTPRINELGLVAFDTVMGSRSIFETMYKRYVKPMLLELYNTKVTESTQAKEESDQRVIDFAENIKYIIDNTLIDEQTLGNLGNARMASFVSVIYMIYGGTAGNLDRSDLMDRLSANTNIAVEAFYNQNHEIQYTEDEFLTILSGSEFDALTVDEAERIKLMTYYTFNSIPLEENTSILFDYRIYAN